MLMISKMAKCPFYVEEDKNTIKCEGLVSTQSIHRFNHKSDKDGHKDKFCNNLYSACKYFQAVEKKY